MNKAELVVNKRKLNKLYDISGKTPVLSSLKKNFVFFVADDLKDKCEKLLCRCDRNAARCLRKAPFIPKFALWPDFLCGHQHPMCNIY